MSSYQFVAQRLLSVNLCNMGKTYKESHYAGSKQSKAAEEYQSKKKIKHVKMTAYNRTNFKRCVDY